MSFLEYKCNKCGKTFTSDKLVCGMEYDHPGAPVSVVYFSPCCIASYTDEW